MLIALSDRTHKALVAEAEETLFRPEGRSGEGMSFPQRGICSVIRILRYLPESVEVAGVSIAT